MKTKSNTYIHTFLVLSIILCILVGSTTIIYAIYEINSQIASDAAVTTNITKSEKAEPAGPVPAKSSNSASAQAMPSSTASAPSITISAVGDLMAHQGNLNCAYNARTSTYDFSGFLEHVKPYLTSSDLTIGNFETVTAGPASGYSSYPMFNTPDTMLTALASAGFDILSTANNHCLDRGLEGLVRTIKKINENKMINVGCSVDGKNKYIIKEIKNIKIGILSYSSAFNGNDKKLSLRQKSTHLSPINEAQIKSDIKAVKTKGTDAVILVMHWGNEYKREPDAGQTALTNKLLSWGADIILGSHPHVIQKSEIKKVNGKNKFVIYSMGNFISGYRRTDKAKRPNKIYTEDGVIVNLSIEKDPKGGILIKKADYIPTWVDKSYTGGKPVFKIIPIPDSTPTGKYITKQNREFIKQSYKNTMSILAKLN